MNAIFKITRGLFETIKVDLLRPHKFALERMGWIRCRVATAPGGTFLILAHDYFSVEDNDYVDSQIAAATIGSDAVRKAMQIALNKKISIFLVHMHDHDGPTKFSGTDRTETERMIPDFFNVRPDMPHGAVVFSRNSIYGRCWYSKREIINIKKSVIVGAPILSIEQRP